LIRLNWKLTFFSLFFFVSFLKLGFWQLDRKDEKITLIMKKAELSESKGIEPSDITSATESGTPVVLKGACDKKVILLLDNKILDGVVGFEVLQLFRDQSGLNFLVNRGFVPAGRTRSENPEIPKIEDFLGAFEGYVYRQTTNPYTIEAEKVDYNFPQIVQTPGTFDLSKKLNSEISPFIIRMRDKQAGALPRSWQVSNIKPEKHQAYAVQWFLMSLAILMAWLSFTIRFNRNERDH
jgi:surfeit locus 1 family protein